MPLPMSAFQIADDLGQRIRSGEWAPGEPLPTYVQLAVHYRVSRTTIALVVKLLKDRGLVVSQPGRALFVAEDLDF